VRDAASRTVDVSVLRPCRSGGIGERFTWHRGDVIAALAWRPAGHYVESGVTLLCTTDELLMRAVGRLRVPRRGDPKRSRACLFGKHGI